MSQSSELMVFSHFLRPGKQGGVESYLQSLMQGFEQCGLPVRDWGRGSYGFGGRFAAEQVDILRFRPDRLLLPNYFTPPLRPTRSKISTVVHDLLFRSYPESLPKLKRAWLNWAIPNTLSRSDQVIAISEFTRRDILSNYPHSNVGDRITVIHNPIDLSRFSAPPTDVPKIEGPFVLCPSSGFWHKNIQAVVNLFSSRPTLSEYKLVLVGASPHQLGWSANTAEFRRSYSALLGTGNAIELGYVSDAVLGHLYRSASVVAIPSLYEGFGMPIFEAIALGTSVVCGKVGAAPELLEGYEGLLDNIGDMDEWEHAILKVAERSPAESLSKKLATQLSPRAISLKYYEACA